jgi:hypothetical protein
MKITEILYLVEGYKEAQTEFSADSDSASVQKTINDFKQLVSRNQIKDINQKNIDWWRQQGWDQFSSFVQKAIVVPSKTQVTRKKIPGKSITLMENDDWLIVIPLNKDASCFHGKNSDWCTTKINQSNFEQYFYDKEVTLIYCLNKKTAGMWAIAVHKNTKSFELFNQQDKKLSPQKFKEQTGLDADELRTMALGSTHQPNIQSSRNEWRASIELTKNLLSNLPEGHRSTEIENQLMYNKYGYLCSEYLKKIGINNASLIPSVIQLSGINDDGLVIQYIKNPSDQFQMAAVNQAGLAIRYIKNPNEQVQLAAVNNNYRAIKFIDNPSEQVQLIVVKKNGEYIKNIIDSGIYPSEQVQIAAVKRDGLVIKYIKNPSEKVQLAAVRRTGHSISYIKNPSEKVQMMAVINSGTAIKYIKNPSDQLQMEAVNQDGLAIQYIKNPSEQVQLAAVKNSGYSIRYINDPSERVQIEAVSDNGSAIQYIKNPSERVQLYSIKNNPRSIIFIDNPSERAQIRAIMRDPYIISHLKNPSEKVKQFVAKKNKDNI